MRKQIHLISLGLCLLQPLARADINDILNLQEAINSFCGAKMSAIMVDETHVNPPCLLNYSESCEEAQPQTAQSCQVVLSEQENKPNEGQMVHASW